MLADLAVLIVEDHPDIRLSLERLVASWSAASAFSADNFLSAAVWIKTVEKIDLLLCDVYFPGKMAGIDITALAVVTHPRIAVVMTPPRQWRPDRSLPFCANAVRTRLHHRADR